MPIPASFPAARRWLLPALLLAVLVSAGCGTPLPTPDPVRLTLAASSSALPLADTLARAYQTAFPHISVDVLVQANEAAATQAVLTGRADAALIAGPAPEGVAASRVASDALAIVVHPDRPLDNLTSQQVHDIFSGRLRAWEELDAGEGEIRLALREENAATRLILAEAFLAARAPALTALVLPDDARLLALVAGDPQAIAALPAG